MKKPARVAVELVRDDSGNYQVTKITHASNIPLNKGEPLRVGSKIWSHEPGDTRPDDLVDAMAKHYDVTVKRTKEYVGME